MKNFDYLGQITALADLYHFCNSAENAQKTDYDVCALNCRRGLEWIVKAIYKLKNIEIGERDNLYELLTAEPFTSFIGSDEVGRELMSACHYVRKVGNKSAHSGGVTGKDAFFALLSLYNLVGGILLKLRVLKTLAPFDKNLIPDAPSMSIATPVNDTPTEQIKTIISQEAVANPASIPDDTDFSEAETRRMFIDLMLEEAGWEVLTKDGAIMPSKACIEVELQGMPNNAGVGYADYVLFGADGKPLAVVEAKRTTKSPTEGKHQAELYAECLEKKYGVKPIIYYSNGFQTFIIDGLGYSSREVLGFHTEDDLNVLHQRRTRCDITDFSVKDEITDREYQKRAIKSICEHFNTKHRRGLLVMATGTGKTRVSISLCDVLMRNKWVKNILFLADRTALVNQAHKNFVKLLPDTTTCVLSDKKNPDKNARIMFSTYQTMINYIDTDTKEFSVGRFDLIIIDEAHRSVFGKYTAILKYFDALIVGLTATPRDDVDKSTYELLELDDEPNFAYELKEAIDDGYLVDYNVIARTTDILKNGIKYENLSDDEKKQMEDVWNYEQVKEGLEPDDKYHRDIKKSEIFKYIFNKDTVDKVLVDLMTNGQKVGGGDVIGKTIIFAYNHQHAELIVERFNALYPTLTDYCTLIDYSINYSQDLINSFEMRDKLPQIAVNVDMLDTGIDVPDILNLVFFKPIYSKIKFWQMIGRGTRLSENIFDDGTDKQMFYIFDWCGVFEYFSQHPKGKEPLPQISLTERLFGLRTDLSVCLQHQNYQLDEYAKTLHDDLKDILFNQVKTLDITHISVRSNLSHVSKYQQKDSWTYISSVDALELKEKIAPLLAKEKSDEGAKKFDILMLYIELSLVDKDVDGEQSKMKVETIANALQEKASIPQVAKKMELINDVAGGTYWAKGTLKDLEYLRTELRELVKFLLGSDNRTFVLNIKDAVEPLASPKNIKKGTYKQRIIDFLAENRNLPVLQKIFNMEQLGQEDIIELEKICWQELGTKEEYEKYVEKGNMLCGDEVAIFIRSQIGVDRGLAVKNFSQFLSDNRLNSLQEEYIKTIIAYVCENGDITSNTLIDEAPFSDYDIIEVFGNNAMYVGQYVNQLHNVVACNHHAPLRHAAIRSIYINDSDEEYLYAAEDENN